MPLTNHTELLNALVEKYDLKSYLEIGVQNPANNFEKIKVDFKIGVDPEVSAHDVLKLTSNDFFIQYEGNHTFDLIFIDGLHHADQVKKDFENSLRCLNPGGFIVIHDCLPELEETTIVPRQTKVWHGDVYKFCMTISLYTGLHFVTYPFDHGCMVVCKTNTLPNKRFEELDEYMNQNETMSWETYKKHGKMLMNVTDELSV
jgi:SAM-dependent methyltransferase